MIAGHSHFAFSTRADGNIQEATSYVIDLDFAASGHPSFRNVGLTFHDVPVFFYTGNIPASTFNLFNLEAGMNLVSVHMVAEMRWAMVNQNAGPGLTFPCGQKAKRCKIHALRQPFFAMVVRFGGQ